MIFLLFFPYSLYAIGSKLFPLFNKFLTLPVVFELHDFHSDFNKRLLFAIGQPEWD